MKIQHYCYTRGGDIDYGNFSYPNNLSKYDLEIVRQKVLSLLGDDVEKNMNIPKWVFIKTPTYIVWGICCVNKFIATNKYLDHKNRPIRGFFSIVITEYTNSNVSLPFDYKYFKELYITEVETYWEQWQQHECKTNGFIAGNFNYISASHNNYVNLLNTDIFQCQSLGELDKDRVIAAALTLSNISLLIDNDNIEQATNKKGAFMNCLTSSVGFGVHAVKQQCPKCKKYVSSFTAIGVCQECKDSEELKKYKIKKEEEEMNQQIKTELKEARNKITELESEVKNSNSKLKNKDRWMKIWAIVSAVLLIVLLYTQDLFSLKLFKEKQETQFLPNETSHSGSYDYYDNNYIQQRESFKFSENNIDVEACSHKEFPIKVKSNNNNYKVVSDVDWINVLSNTKDQIVVEIFANETVERVGKITVSYGNKKSDCVVIKQKGRSN